MKDFAKELLELANPGYDLLDPASAVDVYQEVREPYGFVSPQLSSDELSQFDSFAIPGELSLTQKHSAVSISEWRQAARVMEANLSNGLVWLYDEDDNTPISPEMYQSLFSSAIDHLNSQQPGISLTELLARFDSWAGTPMDILSPYGDFDFGHNIFGDGFEVNVPISISSENEEIVVRANIPWMKHNRIDSRDLYPSELNLKSVLSLLPVRVNSQEMKVSFENGEFKLEMPRVEEAQLHKRAL